MNFTREYVLKAIACAALLPPPGDDEVRRFAEDWLEMADLIAATEAKADRPKCQGCGNEIDHETCWCGEAIKGQAHDNHSVVPQGCTCGFHHLPEHEDE